MILNASTFGMERKGSLKDKEKQPFREGKICQERACKRHKKNGNARSNYSGISATNSNRMKSLQEELKDKDEGQNIHGRCKLLGMSAQQINPDVADHSQHDSIGDAVSQRHKDDTDKRRNGF